MIDTLHFFGGAGKYKYECERLMTAFYPSARLCFDKEPDTGGYVSLYSDGGRLRAVLSDDERREKSAASSGDDTLDELILCGLMYDLLSEHTGITLPWGILTGVRPIKVIRTALYTRPDAKSYISDLLRVSKEKLDIAKSIISVQDPILDMLSEKSVSLYISIPFCPTRCSYCSFISSSGGALKLKDEYFELLLKELDVCRALIQDAGLNILTIYIGGGTPTTLSAEQLKRLTDKLAQFELSHLKEFTAEAGRPDTVTKEKLIALKGGGVSRISINPQTLSDEVLRAIGRSHTVEQFFKAFYLARGAGFDNINTDIIAGLPKDTEEGFADTVDRLIKLRPENITLHTLSIKRSAALNADKSDISYRGAGNMVASAQKALWHSGYRPYYLYRQKNIADNLENAGYCLSGKECLYNIFMMEDAQSIIAAGCAGSSKFVKKGVIKRSVNFKYPYEYVSRFDEVISRKRQAAGFFK